MTARALCGQSWREWTGGEPGRRYDMACRLEAGHGGEHLWLSHVSVLAGEEPLDPPTWVGFRVNLTPVGAP